MKRAVKSRRVRKAWRDGHGGMHTHISAARFLTMLQSRGGGGMSSPTTKIMLFVVFPEVGVSVTNISHKQAQVLTLAL